MKVLIVEDERKSALDLAEMLYTIDVSIEVATILDSVEITIKYLQQEPQPDIAFFDIQLADGLSFEIFSEVQVHCPVIFCTAFDENAITLFKEKDIIYVLKPYNYLKIEKAIKKALHFYKPPIVTNFTPLTQPRQ